MGELSFADRCDMLLNNGPTEVGMSSTADHYDIARDGITMFPTIQQTVSSITFHDDTPDPMRSIVHAGVIYLMQHSARRETSKWRPAAGQPSAAAVGIPSSADLTKAVLLMTAMKLNFWATNHHTGQPKPTGYFARCLNHVGFTVDTHVTALWRLGHWASTHCVLHAAGIEGLLRATESEGYWPKLEADAAVRAASRPAGAARVFDCLEIIRMVRASAYVVFFPRGFRNEYVGLARTRAAISAHPAAYHPGAKYLTGYAPHLIPEPSPELIEACASFAQSLFIKHTISRAAAFGERRVNQALRIAIGQGMAAAASSHSDPGPAFTMLLREASATDPFHGMHDHEFVGQEQDDLEGDHHE